MSRLSKKQLEDRMSKLKASARAEVAKTEVMHFRIDAPSIERLYVLAAQKKKPVGALVRQWVLERIELESNPSAEMTVSLFDVNQRLQAIEKHLNL
jgi:hypothetical protein